MNFVLKPLLCLALWPLSLSARPAQIVVPVLDHPAPLELGFNTEEWRQAARVFGFSVLADAAKPAAQETEVRFLADQDALYIGLQGRIANGSAPRRSFTTERAEPTVWKEDSVEVFLAPEGKTGKDYFHFLVGASGAHFQRQGGTSAGWQPVWERRVTWQDGSWLALIKIPFRELGLSGLPSALRFAVARNAYEPTPEMSRLISTSTGENYVETVEQMGTLLFDRQAPVAAVSAKKDFSLGDIVLFADAARLPADSFADSILEVVDGNGQVVMQDQQQPRFDSRTAIHRISGIPDGAYTLRYRMQHATSARVAVYGADAGLEKRSEEDLAKTATRWEWPVRVQSKLQLQSKVTLPERASKLRAEVTTRGQLPSGPDVQLVFLLKDKTGAVVEELGTKPLAAQVVFESNLPDLPERTDFFLETSVVQNGQNLASSQEVVKIPPKPQWLDTKVGLTDAVPKPWTPVVLEGRKVSVWGRTYDFSSGPVPTQVISQNREMLAQPSRLDLQPAPQSWKLLKARTEGQPARAAVFAWESEGGSVTYRAVTRVEFDGAMRIEVTVPGQAEVKRMAFELPVQKEFAKFVHRGPLMWGTMNNSYSLPDKSEHYKILTVFHFLDDKGGITWFDLMNFDWKLARPDYALEMIPGQNDVLLRVNYIDEPSRYDQDRTFAFGLQALPARPMPETNALLRWWTGVSYGDESPTLRPAWFSDVEYEAIGNVDMLNGTAELWVKPAYEADYDRTERLLSIEHGKNYKLQLLREPSGLAVRLVGAGGGQNFPVKHDLPPDRWSHLALTWTTDAVRLYLNGQEVAHFPVSVAQHFNVPAHRIYAGGDQVFVDGLKISSVAKMAFLPDQPPTVDAETLLCDTFDNVGWVNGRRASYPEKASAATEAGFFSPDTERGEGRWGKGLAPLKVPVKSTIQGMADCGLTMIMYHASQYTDISCGGLYIADEPAFEKLNQAAHDAGLKVCLYINNSLSNYDWMWQTYAKDWLIEPRDAPFIQAGIPNEHVYQVSPRSEYFEFFIWRLSELQKTYGVDGFFLDGRMYCTSRNPGHEPILQNFEGEEVARRDMWDGRNRQMRVMNTIHENGGFYLQHKSGLWDAPPVFFNDGVWEGEQLMGTEKGDRKLTDMLPLESFRAQISGINFGMPSGYAAPPYSPLNAIEAVTYSFVHGTTPTPFYRIDEALVYRPFWKALDRFGATYQNFRGYWSERSPAKSVPQPETTKVSAHVREGKTLLLVSNFDTKPVKGTMTVDLESLGLKTVKVTNALTGEAVESRDGRVPIAINSMRSDWFILEETP